MTLPLITAFYAGLNGLILIWLTANVVRYRRSGRIAMGDNGDPAVAKAIRGHANAAETMPMMLIMLALAELIGAPAVAIHVAGGVFTIGRILHGLHFVGAASIKFRMYGMIMTLSAMGLTALGLTVHALTQIA
ncbi:MAG: MAPEG family protein [Pseudomonadota bacterium]